MVAGVGSSGVGTAQDNIEVAPGNERMLEALNEVQGLTWRTSHQKCFVWGSRRGNEIVRTRAGAGFGEVRYDISVVIGVGSGDNEACASGEGARGA